MTILWMAIPASWRVRCWGSNDITRTLILTTRFKSANFFFLQIRQSNPEVHWFSRQSDHFLLLNRSQPAWNLDLCRFHQSPVSNQSIALTRYLENNIGCEDKVPPHLAKTKSAETVIWIKKYCFLAPPIPPIFTQNEFPVRWGYPFGGKNQHLTFLFIVTPMIFIL